LFATYGFSVQKLAEVQAHSSAEAITNTGTTGTTALRWLILILPFLGVAISFYSLKGVIAAQHAISQLKRDWEAGQALPVIIGGGYSGGGNRDEEGPGGDAHSDGFKAPKMFPRIFIAVWVMLFLTYAIPWLYYFWSAWKR
jgi:hypothetical protein